MNLERWLQRGDDLKCFANSTDQMKYLEAWERSDLVVLQRHLERIFTRSHRLPTINWLNRPDLVTAVDKKEDGPSGLLEDWEESDFSVLHPLGVTMSPAWLRQENSWNEMLAGLTRLFIFSKASEKFDAIQKWETSVTEAYQNSGKTLSVLVEMALRAEFIQFTADRSPYIRDVVIDRDLIVHAATELKRRAFNLLSLWEQVDSNQHEPLPSVLTLGKIRRAQHMVELDGVLRACTGDLTKNLLTYLRCRDYDV